MDKLSLRRFIYKKEDIVEVALQEKRSCDVNAKLTNLVSDFPSENAFDYWSCRLTREIDAHCYTLSISSKVDSSL